MATYHRNEGPEISITDAVETLSCIADLDFDKEIGVTQKNTLVLQDADTTFRNVQWVQDADEAVRIVRDTFRAVLHHLEYFYHTPKKSTDQKETIEGIKTIMLLVGEAAHKLDKYTSLFKNTKEGSVTRLSEYQRLQDFYQAKLAKKIEQEGFSKWIEELPHKFPPPENVHLKGTPQKKQHVFVDLEQVKRDTEYELFYIRREDGSLFYSPQVMRSIKLVKDFGNYFKGSMAEDPRLSTDQLIDKSIYVAAKNILEKVTNELENYCQLCFRYKDGEFVNTMNKAIIALMSASNSAHLLVNSTAKSCRSYFNDFQYFLREALATYEYNKWVVYPPKPNNQVARHSLKLIQAICLALFTGIRHFPALIPELEEVLIKLGLIDQSKSSNSHTTWIENLKKSYEVFNKLIKKYPQGPLTKIVQLLEKERVSQFDPLVQDNLPHYMYDIKIGNHKIAVLSIPSPTQQEIIHRAKVSEEFKTFLRSYHVSPHKIKKHLLINLQDRTGWKEHARCIALEELQKQKDFKDTLIVVSLARNTDFYRQNGPYSQLNLAQSFIEQFKEHLNDENAGYSFPKIIQEVLLTKWVDGIMKSIHKIFFSEKNVLSKKDRLNFIEIFYLCLELKLIEICEVNTVSFTCKDGIDLGVLNSAQLYVFLKLINEDKMTRGDLDYLNMLIYMPALLLRERNLMPERFQRMILTLNYIEHIRTERGFEKLKKQVHEGLGAFYRNKTLDASVTPSQPHILLS